MRKTTTCFGVETLDEEGDTGEYIIFAICTKIVEFEPNRVPLETSHALYGRDWPPPV